MMVVTGRRWGPRRARVLVYPAILASERPEMPPGHWFRSRFWPFFYLRFASIPNSYINCARCK